jgi:hypothetical protein
LGGDLQLCGDVEHLMDNGERIIRRRISIGRYIQTSADMLLWDGTRIVHEFKANCWKT